MFFAANADKYKLLIRTSTNFNDLNLSTSFFAMEVPSELGLIKTLYAKVIYSTNAIESLNSAYRKLNRQRSVFPSNTALLNTLYLASFEATKKWTSKIRNWGQVYGELSITYEERMSESAISNR